MCVLSQCAHGGQRIAFGSQFFFFSSTIWVLGVGLREYDLAVSTFTC